MPIDVEWQDENGDTLARYDGPLLDSRLASRGPVNARCMCFIDPYGDTTFNSQQVDVLQQELSAAIRSPGNAEVVEALVALLQFIEQQRDRTHVYLKFLGD